MSGKNIIGIFIALLIVGSLIVVFPPLGVLAAVALVTLGIGASG